MNGKFFWIALIASTGLWSCGDDNDNGSPAVPAILQQPPYNTLTDSLTIQPDNAGLYYKRALLLTQNNEHELAGRDWAKVWELNPTESNTWQFVTNLIVTNQSNKAIEVLTQAIDKFPGQPAFKAKMAEVLVQLDYIHEAIAIYNELIQQDPEQYEWYYELGRTFAKNRNVPDAIQHLEKAYALQPANFIGLDLAELYAYQLNPKVITLCDEIIRNNPPNSIPQASYLKGTYYADKGQSELAIKCFDESIKSDWKFVDAYLDKGYLFFKEGKYKEAKAVYTQCIEVAQQAPDSYYWLGRTEEALGNLDNAKAMYEQTLLLDKDFHEASSRLDSLKKL